MYTLDKYDKYFKLSLGALIDGGKKISTLPKNRYDERLNKEFHELMKSRNIKLSRSIYDENGTTYLDGLEDINSIQVVVKWISILSNDAKGYEVRHFLNYRNEIIKIIDEKYPKVKEGSIRGERELFKKNLKEIKTA